MVVTLMGSGVWLWHTGQGGRRGGEGGLALRSGPWPWRFPAEQMLAGVGGGRDVVSRLMDLHRKCPC